MRSTLIIVIAVASMLAVASVADGRELLQSPAYKRCVGSFNQAGAEAGLRKRVPSCVNFNLQKCCAETKATLNGGNFQGCLCDKEVSSFIEGRLSKAGIAGLNANTFSVFLKTCGIPNAKTGGC
ncbi:hypothetical protein MNEG_0368 [Monoraphidium neglectum]|uniref:Bifunctional inhibitor/plant lipid transfer protein/seed storage helical domain-containing protein n=1 Tax=Monoraphidium neglectum TaxID=145388 RepID=A0A0D2NTW6_9CHLO|nr:hypothetical protein MNEG_0368 [Monoraphidium neglectum]KIZ07576.1 hypothetical protein MNEG_0368 [Monoraphidium neglectum]|eukprot:XP_013906595.1 hypothetical protein MNEG_0368 [Monoraphidium neglectum]